MAVRTVVRARDASHVRQGMLLACVAIAGACSKETAAPLSPAPTAPAANAPAASAPAANAPAASGAAPNAGLPAHDGYRDLGAALRAIIPADARVIGFGELHARTDRAQVASSLSAFTAALPAIADKVSDLVIETWLIDPRCGRAAVVATGKIETNVKRPAATKSEISLLADGARAAHIQPHAMTLGCADYAAIAPPGGEVDAVAMLTLTTRELQRIATSAVIHRDREPGHRPWIAVYGGALHNDRFPDASVAEWSYAAEVDRATGDRFVEIDVIVPELAEADAQAHSQPWFTLARAPRDPAHRVLVWKRGERSFVVLLPPT